MLVIMEGKLSRQGLLRSFLFSLWIVLVCLLINALHLGVYWPAFTVLNLLTVIGFNKENYLKIFTSSVSGILFALLYIFLGNSLTLCLGPAAAYFLVLFLIMFFLMAFQLVFPMFINTHAFIVFTYCTVDLEMFSKTWPQTLICALLGGGVVLAGTMAITRLVSRIFTKNNRLDHPENG